MFSSTSFLLLYLPLNLFLSFDYFISSFFSVSSHFICLTSPLPSVSPFLQPFMSSFSVYLFTRPYSVIFFIHLKDTNWCLKVVLSCRLSSLKQNGLLAFIPGIYHSISYYATTQTVANRQWAIIIKSNEQFSSKKDVGSSFWKRKHGFLSRETFFLTNCHRSLVSWLHGPLIRNFTTHFITKLGSLLEAPPSSLSSSLLSSSSSRSSSSTMLLSSRRSRRHHRRRHRRLHRRHRHHHHLHHWHRWRHFFISRRLVSHLISIPFWTNHLEASLPLSSPSCQI